MHPALRFDSSGTGNLSLFPSHQCDGRLKNYINLVKAGKISNGDFTACGIMNLRHCWLEWHEVVRTLYARSNFSQQ